MTQQQIFVMIRKEHIVPEVIETISAMTGAVPMDDVCVDCGVECLRAEGERGISGFARGEKLEIADTAPDAIRVCSLCASKRAFEAGDVEAAYRYGMAHAAMEEAMKR